MTGSIEALWISASRSLKAFDHPLMGYLAGQTKLAQWEYCQTQDEGGSVDTAIALLHDYLQHHDPVHLIGHGISGIIALLYSRRYPEQVKSLTLLSVAAQPAVTWQAHYYVQRQLLPCSQTQVLGQMMISLFGRKLPYSVKDIITALRADLENAPSLHSLFKVGRLPQGGVAMPLLVCGSKTDPIVDPAALADWEAWFKPEDRQWQCLDGYHFFHYFHPQLVGEQILEFWQFQSARKSLLQLNR
ncbi:alpha/beta fold hydrolase [Myxacorys almedinensis]|uniref:Alpha/beta hydrolase n=1 Tax=Myxacorys almedinensis A TaxID=2690445 RepID=A0A8J7Z251_9CYAN|nr:alpha/beta hydrolase [Myxacorys almedinensis]NDJ18264.1 alpha/beta hydrolase [Myxacorys almedinensis A]